MAKLNQVDVFFVARELDEMLGGARLDNAYEYEDGRVRLKFRHERLGVRHVLVTPGVTAMLAAFLAGAPALAQRLKNLELTDERGYGDTRVYFLTCRKGR